MTGSRLASEAALASLVLDTDLPTGRERTPAGNTHANVLVDVAKRIQRLQTKRSKLRRDLAVVDQELKLRKKELKALIREVSGKDRS